ncbi:hypothetical protein N8751_00050 [bacterium]|nr:hypothetical protein [bacterium]
MKSSFNINKSISSSCLIDDYYNKGISPILNTKPIHRNSSMSTNHLVDIELFDVSMRDGLQTYKHVMPTNKKKLLVNQLIEQQNPESIEIGSIVSQKVLPQFFDSIPLYNWAKNEYKDKEFYILTPNIKAVEVAIENKVDNLSFITSVSSAFQEKNIKKTLLKTKEQLRQMYDISQDSNIVNNIKLYISCINECPISGFIDKDFIVDEIERYYYEYPNITNICLSDTCGTLSYYNFKYILDKLDSRVPISNLSLHLHYSNKHDIDSILRYAYNHGLNRLDVSYLENSGGCSVTIDSGKTNANLSYENLESVKF